MYHSMKNFKRNQTYTIYNEETKFNKPKYYVFIGNNELGYNFKAVYNAKILHIPFSEIDDWHIKEDSIGPAVKEIIRQEISKLIC